MLRNLGRPITRALSGVGLAYLGCSRLCWEQQKRLHVGSSAYRISKTSNTRRTTLGYQTCSHKDIFLQVPLRIKTQCNIGGTWSTARGFQFQDKVSHKKAASQPVEFLIPLHGSIHTTNCCCFLRCCTIGHRNIELSRLARQGLEMRKPMRSED